MKYATGRSGNYSYYEGVSTILPIPGVLKRILYVRVLFLADTVKTVPLLLGYVLGGDNGGVTLLVIA